MRIRPSVFSLCFCLPIRLMDIQPFDVYNMQLCVFFSTQAAKDLRVSNSPLFHDPDKSEFTIELRVSQPQFISPRHVVKTVSDSWAASSNRCRTLEPVDSSRNVSRQFERLPLGLWCFGFDSLLSAYFLPRIRLIQCVNTRSKKKKERISDRDSFVKSEFLSADHKLTVANAWPWLIDRFFFFFCFEIQRAKDALLQAVPWTTKVAKLSRIEQRSAAEWDKTEERRELVNGGDAESERSAWFSPRATEFNIYCACIGSEKSDGIYVSR